MAQMATRSSGLMIDKGFSLIRRRLSSWNSVGLVLAVAPNAQMDVIKSLFIYLLYIFASKAIVSLLLSIFRRPLTQLPHLLT